MRKLDFKFCVLALCALVSVVQGCSEDEELELHKSENLIDDKVDKKSPKNTSNQRALSEECFDANLCYLNGYATSVGSNSNGALWIIGTTKRGGGYNIYTRDFETDSWVSVYGGAIAIDVDPQGFPWIVNNAGNIYRFTTSNTWERMPGAAKDIGISDNGDVWIIGTTKRTGGYSIFWWNPRQDRWVSSGGSGVRISVDGQGRPWIVNDRQNIYRRNSPNALTSSEWTRFPGDAYDIGCGSGRVVITGTNLIPYRLNAGGDWDVITNAAAGFTIDVLGPTQIIAAETGGSSFRRIWTKSF